MARKRIEEPFLITPFTILIDDREGAPWTFLGQTKKNRHKENVPYQVLTKKKRLKTGDYAIEGFEDKFVIERKSLTDLYHSVSSGRENLELEFQRMAKLHVAVLICEQSDYDVIFRPPHDTQVQPTTVMNTTFSWTIRYPNVHWRFAPSRYLAEAYALRYFEKFFRQFGLEESPEKTSMAAH